MRTFVETIIMFRQGAMVWEGANVVKEGRKMLGATMPSESACGTIRGDFW
jgi:nucleoside diphosphate kinase